MKYGVTADYVLGMDVVLADGTLVRLGGKQIKDVAGLSLLKLFVGSEGTLGIITRAILRLIPAQTAGATLVGGLPDDDGGVASGGRDPRPGALLDAGADGQHDHQRGRGLALPRPRPGDRCAAARPVRRDRRRLRDGDRR